MQDPRLNRLAEILVEHSCQLKTGDKLLIEAYDLPDPALVCRLIELAALRGAHPLVTWKNNAVLRSLYTTGSKTNLALAGDFEKSRMQEMNAYIGIRGAANSSQFSDVPAQQMELYQKHWWHPVHSEVRVPHTRWVVLRYPTDSMAQAADMSTEAFEDFYFSVCTTDYAQMARDQQPLVRRMQATDRVRLVGPATDLTFSIKGMNVRPCHGQRNIPDGEVFTAPLRESVEGVIQYNAPSRYQGTVFQDIRFEFRQGKIVRATCSGDSLALNKILDADEGARYIGEWSIGCNNKIRRPMLDTLFDEKIGGSIHLTPGNAYKECDNGNRSCIHWDLVFIQTPQYGGGEIWFDDELIRRDGRFLPAELQPLNDGLA
jgi:aminopeptidase